MRKKLLRNQLVLNTVNIEIFIVSNICISGVDPGFPIGGGASPLGRAVPTYDFAKVCEKLHEIDKILGHRGGTCQGHPPKSATAYDERFKKPKLKSEIETKISDTLMCGHSDFTNMYFDLLLFQMMLLWIKMILSIQMKWLH